MEYTGKNRTNGVAIVGQVDGTSNENTNSSSNSSVKSGGEGGIAIVSRHDRKFQREMLKLMGIMTKGVKGGGGGWTGEKDKTTESKGQNWWKEQQQSNQQQQQQNNSDTGNDSGDVRRRQQQTTTLNARIRIDSTQHWMNPFGSSGMEQAEEEEGEAENKYNNGTPMEICEQNNGNRRKNY